MLGVDGLNWQCEGLAPVAAVSVVSGMRSINLLRICLECCQRYLNLKVAIEFCPMFWFTDKANVICVLVPRIMPHQKQL